MLDKIENLNGNEIPSLILFLVDIDSKRLKNFILAFGRKYNTQKNFTVNVNEDYVVIKNKYLTLTICKILNKYHITFINNVKNYSLLVSDKFRALKIKNIHIQKKFSKKENIEITYYDKFLNQYFLYNLNNLTFSELYTYIILKHN